MQVLAMKDKEKRQTKHHTATTIYPCFRQDLGEFDRSWSYPFATAKVAYLAIS